MLGLKRQYRSSFSRTRKRQAPDLGHIARDRLAVIIVVLFASICITASFTSNIVVADKLLPFITPALTFVLHYYFGRRKRL
jgi:hypothetical protein